MRIFTRKNVLSFDFTNTEIKVVEISILEKV